MEGLIQPWRVLSSLGFSRDACPIDTLEAARLHPPTEIRLNRLRRALGEHAELDPAAGPEVEAYVSR